MPVVIVLDNSLTETYMAHAALLAVKLLALSPMAAMTWVRKGVFPNSDVVRRAYLTELKILSPFWIVGALYITTEPYHDVGVTLFRMYTLSRIVIVMGYITKPAPPVFTDLALVVSYCIMWYMTAWVVLFYRNYL